ncbi:MAG: polysaccharide biosynthesis C-terminal domain-containing protein, partial [Oscillospiraceae bacterium]|nr:polysaccharide biosynthesis C-terminal domain-containing protein [Oscillospiraceae bacterium]
GAGFVGEKLMGEARAVVSLRIFSLDMPFISMGAVLGGYFTARKKAGILAAIQLFEQIVRIAATMAALRSIDVGSLESSCAAMVFGSVSGETAGFLLSAVLFIIDRRALKIGNSPPGVFRRIIKIAPPLAVAAYVRTALNALCGMLVPRGLRSYGAEAEAALSSYGVINGMALPIAAFPSALFLSVAELVVPEMTEAQVKGSWERIKSMVSSLLVCCLAVSLAIMLLLLLLSDFLGQLFYKSSEVGAYIRAFSFLMPVMYLDTVTDGILKGLGQQLYTMKVNIADSALSLLLIFLLLPSFGTSGYMVMLYFTEIFNFVLSIGRLFFIVYRSEEKIVRKAKKPPAFY